MASILTGAAKVQINLIDKSVYSPVVGGNIVGIIGVFNDGKVDEGNFISTRSELTKVLGSPVRKYNQGTKLSYAYDAAFTALGTHNSMYVFRVTDGTEESGKFKPVDSIFRVVTSNKTDRWNGVHVLMNSVETYSTPDESFYQKYSISFYDTDKNELESYEGNLKPDSDEFIMNVVNNNSLRFRIELTDTLKNNDELADTLVNIDKFNPTKTTLGIPLVHNGVASDYTITIGLRSGSTRSSSEFKVIHTENSTSHSSWSIEQVLGGLILNVSNITNIKLSTLFSIINSYVAYEITIKDKNGNTVDMSKSERSDYVVQLGDLIKDSFKSSEVTTETSSGSTITTGVKLLTNTPNNIISGGKSGTDTIGTEDFIRQIQLLESTSEYPINLVAAPGIVDPAIHKFIDSVISKKALKCLQIVDIQDYSEPSLAIKGTQTYNSKSMMINYPWIIGTTSDGVKQKLPPSGEILQTIGYSDANGEPWFAPAGLRRGSLLTATGVSRKLLEGDIDLLQTYPNVINPIVIEEGGVVLWGNTTAYRVSSKLREVSVMRLSMYLTKVLETSSRQYLFQPNTSINHDQWKLDTNAVMDDVMSRQGVYEYQVLLGESDGTMTSYHFDRNIAKAVVKFKPVGYIHFFVVDMEVHSYGSSFTVSEE